MKSVGAAGILGSLSVSRGSVSRWWMEQQFAEVRLEFYQDYLDSKMMMREYAQARAAQLKRRGNASHKPVSIVADKLRQGKAVALALKDIAPASDVALVSAFENSNRLNEGFAEIVRKVTEEKALKKEVVGALVKPAIYLIMALAMVTGGIPFMVDSVGPLLDKATQTLDQRALIAFSSFMQSFAGIILPGLIGLLVATVASLPLWTGALRRKFDAYSPIHRMYRAYHGASFLKVLAIQLSVSPQLDRALSAIAVNSNPWLRSYILTIMRRLPHHRTNPMEAFDVGLLDANVIDSLTLISRSGTAEAAIALRADQSTKQAVKTIRTNAMVLQQSAIALAGVLLIWVTLSLVLNVIKTNMDRMQQTQSSGGRR